MRERINKRILSVFDLKQQYDDVDDDDDDDDDFFNFCLYIDEWMNEWINKWLQ